MVPYRNRRCSGLNEFCAADVECFREAPHADSQRRVVATYRLSYCESPIVRHSRSVADDQARTDRGQESTNILFVLSARGLTEMVVAALLEEEAGPENGKRVMPRAVCDLRALLREPAVFISIESESELPDPRRNIQQYLVSVRAKR